MVTVPKPRLSDAILNVNLKVNSLYSDLDGNCLLFTLKKNGEIILSPCYCMPERQPNDLAFSCAFEIHIAYNQEQLNSFLLLKNQKQIKQNPRYYNPFFHFAHLRSVWTHPDFRKKGVALRSLILGILTVHRLYKTNFISLDVLDGNSDAQKLYDKLGFEKCEGTHRRLYLRDKTNFKAKQVGENYGYDVIEKLNDLYDESVCKHKNITHIDLGIL